MNAPPPESRVGRVFELSACVCMALEYWHRAAMVPTRFTVALILQKEGDFFSWPLRGCRLAASCLLAAAVPLLNGKHHASAFNGGVPEQLCTLYSAAAACGNT